MSELLYVETPITESKEHIRSSEIGCPSVSQNIFFCQSSREFTKAHSRAASQTECVDFWTKSREMCELLCTPLSPPAHCTSGPCSRGDSSQRLGCNYTPLSAPSLCPREEEGRNDGEKRWKEKAGSQGGDKAGLDLSLCVCVCGRTS